MSTESSAIYTYDWSVGNDDTDSRVIVFMVLFFFFYFIAMVGSGVSARRAVA